MHNPESVLENETHKLLWDFETQTDHLTSARQPDLVRVNQKKMRTCQLVDFPFPADHGAKLKESKKWDKYLELAREQKKLWNMKVKVIAIVIGALVTVTKRIDKGTRGLGNKRTSGDHPNDSIIKIGQNAEKSPGDLRRLAVTQTPVRILLLILV